MFRKSEPRERQQLEVPCQGLSILSSPVSLGQSPHISPLLFVTTIERCSLSPLIPRSREYNEGKKKKKEKKEKEKEKETQEHEQ